MSKWKVSQRIVFLCAILLVFLFIVSGLGIWSLVKVKNNSLVLTKTDQVARELLELRRQEKNFALRGFKKLEGDKLNSVEKWEVGYNRLMELCSEILKDKTVPESYKKILESSLEISKKYREAFINKYVASYSPKEEAFSDWRNLAENITKQLNLLPSGEILHEFKEAFILLRLRAIYAVYLQDERAFEAYSSQLAAVKNVLAKLEENLSSGDESSRKTISTLKGFVEAYEEAGKKYYQAFKMGVEGEKEMIATARESLEKLDDLANIIRKNSMDSIIILQRVFASCSLLGFILAFLVGFLVTRSITKPLSRVGQDLSSATQQIVSVSEVLISENHKLAEGASQQAASVEESSASIEEISSMAKQNTSRTSEIKDLMTTTQQVMSEVYSVLKDTVTAMDEIKQAGDETQSIVKKIDEIAFQTNLLALNAAVEAARAGEAGAGFAVVADEVRSLALKAAQAAKDTGNLIEASSQKISVGKSLIAKAEKSFENLVSVASKINVLVEDIARSSAEQSTGMEQLSTAIREIDKVVNTNAAAAEHVASIAEELKNRVRMIQNATEELQMLIGGKNLHRDTTSAEEKTASKVTLTKKPVTLLSLPKKDYITESSDLNRRQSR